MLLRPPPPPTAAFPPAQFLGALRFWLERLLLPLWQRRMRLLLAPAASAAAATAAAAAADADDDDKNNDGGGFCALTRAEARALGELLEDANAPTPCHTLARDEHNIMYYWCAAAEGCYYPRGRGGKGGRLLFSPIFAGDAAAALLAHTLDDPRWSAPAACCHRFEGDRTHVSLLLHDRQHHGLALSERFDAVTRRQALLLHAFPPHRARECMLFARLLVQLGPRGLLPPSFASFLDDVFQPLAGLFRKKADNNAAAAAVASGSSGAVVVRLGANNTPMMMGLRVAPEAWVALLSVFLPGIECVAAPLLLPSFASATTAATEPVTMVEGVYGVRSAAPGGIGCVELVTVRRCRGGGNDGGCCYALTRHPTATGGSDFYCC